MIDLAGGAALPTGTVGGDIEGHFVWRSGSTRGPGDRAARETSSQGSSS
jgi:hypothetical protein